MLEDKRMTKWRLLNKMATAFLMDYFWAIYHELRRSGRNHQEAIHIARKHIETLSKPWLV